MKFYFFKTPVILAAVLFMPATIDVKIPDAAAKEEQSYSDFKLPPSPPAKKTKLKFKVPEDWPIEERGNVYAPIPVEEYVTLKLKQMNDKISELETELSKTNEKVKKLETNNEKTRPMRRRDGEEDAADENQNV